MVGITSGMRGSHGNGNDRGSFCLDTDGHACNPEEATTYWNSLVCFISSLLQGFVTYAVFLLPHFKFLFAIDALTTA